jgi:DNA primase
LGTKARVQFVVLAENGRGSRIHFYSTHHLRLGSESQLPYAADRGKKSVNRQGLDELQLRISLLEYLQAHDWQPTRALTRGRWMGLCPLHTDHRPSFLVDANKDLFYCYDCGRGGDVIRFVELYYQVKFAEAAMLLHQWCGLAPLLHSVCEFYRIQLHRSTEAMAYLDQRGTHSSEVIKHMRTIYLAFDADANGGPRASQSLSHRLWPQGIDVRRVVLPDGHDPNSFFVQGGDARQFRHLLEAARP